MRKASWGALGLALFAVATMRPVAVNASLHGILSFGALAGYILLSLDPPTVHARQRAMMIAGVVAGLASFVLVQLVTHATLPNLAVQLLLGGADLLAVAVVALPLWLANRPAQPLFAAAAAAAFMALFLQPGWLGPADLGSVAAFGLCAGTAAWTAYIFEYPRAAAGHRPRIVVAYDVVPLTGEEKAERLARLEKRFRAGEIPEHKYWDLRQEIESK